ncbi:MAG: hypothetical protein KGL39_00985 [Patescibacteria group bacterium]|nr:hypothetical protein [Patescibacteria group bacterium]
MRSLRAAPLNKQGEDRVDVILKALKEFRLPQTPAHPRSPLDYLFDGVIVLLEEKLHYSKNRQIPA